MNTLELKPGQQIGVLYYDDRRGSKAEIGIIAKVSPTGQVTLSNGKRYTTDGTEIGAVEPSYLVSIERAEEVIKKAEYFQQRRDTERQVYLASPEGKRNIVALAAVKAAIAVLNQHGWYADTDGEMDVLELEIEQRIRSYVERHEPTI